MADKRIRLVLGLFISALFLEVMSGEAATWFFCDLFSNGLCIDLPAPENTGSGEDVTLYGVITKWGWVQICTKCHDPNKGARDKSMIKSKMIKDHLAKHFPKYKLALSPGKRLEFQKNIYVENIKGRLFLKSPRLTRVLPEDTMIVKGSLQDSPFLLIKGKPLN